MNSTERDKTPALARVLIAIIRVYQATLSRCLGSICRFEPSCSAYAIACLERRGVVRGGLLSMRRVCKCHPFHPGGLDPPPPPPPRLVPSFQPSPALEARTDARATD